MSAKSKNTSASSNPKPSRIIRWAKDGAGPWRRVGQSKSGKRSRKHIARPFAPGIESAAKALAEKYQYIIGRDDDAGGYFGRCLELPGAMGDGADVSDCMDLTKSTATTLIAYMLENGQRPPTPASEAVRNVQLNIRISVEEKVRFEEAARQEGVDLSEFIRSAAVKAETKVRTTQIPRHS